MNNKWAVAENSLQTTSIAFNADWLLRPASESLADQQVSIVSPLGPTLSVPGLHTPMVLTRATPDRSGYAAWIGPIGPSLVLNLVSITGGVLPFNLIRSTRLDNLTVGQEVIVTLYAIGNQQIATVALASNPTKLLATTLLNDSSHPSGVQGLSPNGMKVNTVTHFATYNGGFKPPAVPPPPPRQIGVNPAFVSDSSTDFLFANALYHARGFAEFNQGYGYGNSAVPLDAQGYPKADFSVIVGSGFGPGSALDFMAGRYTISFSGRAVVTLPDTVGGSIVSHTHDPAKNTSVVVCDLAQVAQPNLLRFAFGNTRRLPTDRRASGLTNLKIMRPIALGSKVSHDPTEIFSRAWLAMVAPFHHLRSLDWTNAVNAYNGTRPIEWSYRTLPGKPIQSQTSGQPDGLAYEWMIAAANANNQNLWLNIPDMASDDYVTKLFQVCRYGSNGVNPYNGPAGSKVSNPVPAGGPIYSPLKGKLYFEWGNEVWNGIFPQCGRNFQMAKDDVSARATQHPPGAPDLNWDGEPNSYYWGYRRVGQQIYRLSNLAKAVFGAENLGTTFAPVLMCQDANTPTISEPLKYIAHVTDGKPETAICFAGGSWYRNTAMEAPDPGSAWYDAKNPKQGRSVDQVIAAGMDLSTPNNIITAAVLNQYAPMVGQACYEGGIDANAGKPASMGGSGGEESNLSRAVEKDPRFADFVTKTINDTFAGGASVITHYSSTHGAWGLAKSPYNLNTPKYQATLAQIRAVNALNGAVKSTPAR